MSDLYPENLDRLAAILRDLGGLAKGVEVAAQQLRDIAEDRDGWIVRATATDEEREALDIAVEYVGSAFQVEHHADVLKRLKDRLHGDVRLAALEKLSELDQEMGLG